MKKKLQFVLFGLAMLFCLPVSSQIKFKGALINNRYDDGEQWHLKYIAFNKNIPSSEDPTVMGRGINTSDFGIWSLTWDGDKLSTPVKEPAVVVSDFYKNGQFIDDEKAMWCSNFLNMKGNSGSVYVDGKLVTITSRNYEDTPDEELFRVCKWDANTGDMFSNEIFPLSSNIESAGMSYNPIDGKVYGFFHITDAKLLDEIVNDPEYYTDQDDEDWGREGLDDGYCLGTIDLNTMKITPITPGLYYGNFVAFAINSEGRAFTLTSGGTAGYIGNDGKTYNIDNQLTGAQLIEINTKTGIMVRNSKTIYEGTDSAYVEYTYPYPATGYCSQTHRQAACFAKSNPNKLYWIGFYNSGKGVNGGSSWTSLPDRDPATGETWRENGKYDTALYEIDLLTGNCQRLAKVPNRCSFSALWIDGDDNSDGTNYFETVGVNNVNAKAQNVAKQVYNLQGVKVNANARGLQIVKEGDKVTKTVVR